MTMPVTPVYYRQMIEEDIEWLEACCNHSVERAHIISVLQDSADAYDVVAHHKAMEEDES